MDMKQKCAHLKLKHQSKGAKVSRTLTLSATGLKNR